MREEEGRTCEVRPDFLDSRGPPKTRCFPVESILLNHGVGLGHYPSPVVNLDTGRSLVSPLLWFVPETRIHSSPPGTGTDGR